MTSIYNLKHKLHQAAKLPIYPQGMDLLLKMMYYMLLCKDVVEATVFLLFFSLHQN